jgi:hypothetical protein
MQRVGQRKREAGYAFTFLLRNCEGEPLLVSSSPRPFLLRYASRATAPQQFLKRGSHDSETAARAESVAGRK